MNRLLLALVSLSFSSAVAAAWVTFMKTETSVVYIDSATVRKEGNLRKAAVLVDLIRKEADGVQSKRGQSEIDCLEDRMRIHGLSGFTGNMASGEAVYSFKGASEWMPIPPKSALWNTIKLICSR